MSAQAAVDVPVVETVEERKTRQAKKPKRQPRYNVILWNDDDHSYPYVMVMLQELFAIRSRRVISWPPRSTPRDARLS